MQQPQTYFHWVVSLLLLSQELVRRNQLGRATTASAHLEPGPHVESNAIALVGK